MQKPRFRAKDRCTEYARVVLVVKMIVVGRAGSRLDVIAAECPRRCESRGVDDEIREAIEIRNSVITLRRGVGAACREHHDDEQWCAPEHVSKETMRVHSREVRELATMKCVREETPRHVDAQCRDAAE